MVRACARSCQATDPDSIGDARLIRCCFQDLCNSGSTVSPGVGVLAVLGAALLGLAFP